MNRVMTAPLLPLLVTAAVLALREGAGDPGAAQRVSAVGPVAVAVDVDREIRSWPASRSGWVVSDSTLRIRFGDDPAAPRASATIPAARLSIGEDGLPLVVELAVGLDALEGVDATFLRDVLGVHRSERLTFVGSRVAVYRRDRISAVTGIDLAGVVAVGPNSRRVDVRLQAVRSDHPERVRLVGSGRIRLSEYGLPSRWGLGPWFPERDVLVVLDLAFRLAGE